MSGDGAGTEREAEWDLLEKSMPGGGADEGRETSTAEREGRASRGKRGREGVDDFGEQSAGNDGDRRRSRSRSRDRDYDQRRGGRRDRRGGRRQRDRRSRSRSRDDRYLTTPEREEERENRRKEREREREKRELEKLDRDTRTVFVVNLNTKLDERGISNSSAKPAR